MISDFKILLIMLLRQLNFGGLVYCRFNSYLTFIKKENLHFSFICSFYFCLVTEGLNPESCLAICHPRASCLQTRLAYKRMYIIYISLYLYLYIYLSIYIYIYLSIYLSIYIYIYLSWYVIGVIWVSGVLTPPQKLTP